MSYLLDAIRKAEKQRSEDGVPTLEGLVKERRVRSRRSRGRGLVVIVVVAALAGLVYVNQTRVSDWWQKAKAEAAGLTHKVGGLWRSEPGSPAAESGEPAAVAPREPSVNAASTITDAQRNLISQIAFTVLSYSTDDDKRFVMVDSQVLREGELLEGFEIIRIQADGVVIRVNGNPVLVKP